MFWVVQLQVALNEVGGLRREFDSGFTAMWNLGVLSQLIQRRETW